MFIKELNMGDLIRVESDNISSTYSVESITTDGSTMIYGLHWEGAINPDEEPKHSLVIGDDGIWYVEFGGMEEAKVERISLKWR